MKIKEELYLVKDALNSLHSFRLLLFFFLLWARSLVAFWKVMAILFLHGFLILYSALSWARKLQKKATDGAKNCSIEVMSRPYYI